MLAGVVLLAVIWKWLGRAAQRCPECSAKREGNSPICTCGWVFETPEGDDDLDYAGGEEDEIRGEKGKGLPP